MNKINSAITLCGGSTQKSCIYDYVLTGESTIALQTKTTQTESTANKLINGKKKNCFVSGVRAFAHGAMGRRITH